MRYNVTVVVQKSDGSYVATCMENQVASQGDTLDEAVRNVREALHLYYADYKDTDELNPADEMYVTRMEIAV